MSKNQERMRFMIMLPSALLLIFFVAPLTIMTAMSFFHRIEGGFFEPGFELTHYQRFFSLYFLQRLAFSLFVAGLASVMALSIAFPFGYLLSRLRKQKQTLWLIFILGILSLSEVVISFCWSVLFSETAGLSNLLVALGLLDKPQAWSPSFGAMMTGLVYLSFPYAVLILYPRFARLDQELIDAAATMGGGPFTIFRTIIIPIMRPAILASLIMLFIFTLGCYLIPQILGRTEHWTIPVLITDQAIFQSNLPFAAAMAILLMLVSYAMIGLIGYIGRSNVNRNLP